eukprot:1072516-Prorocentrum_minimum.AAC.4
MLKQKHIQAYKNTEDKHSWRQATPALRVVGAFSGGFQRTVFVDARHIRNEGPVELCTGQQLCTGKPMP